MPDVYTKWPAKIQGPKRKQKKKIHHVEGGSSKNQSRETGSGGGVEEVWPKPDEPAPVTGVMPTP